MGVQKGDRVVIYMPMIPEVRRNVILSLLIDSIGRYLMGSLKIILLIK